MFRNVTVVEIKLEKKGNTLKRLYSIYAPHLRSIWCGAGWAGAEFALHCVVAPLHHS